eukprot:TRINITY_DN12411_c0_g9_i1.p1 TRINITY_DN12411_c0_g9~~TRINITY_DN12411_c0_g9_i1.p1  ORF type:complete len:204 (+),score=16.07 TRINITY_DN12411_c0_g9_i1:568-1179(+)
MKTTLHYASASTTALHLAILCCLLAGKLDMLPSWMPRWRAAIAEQTHGYGLNSEDMKPDEKAVHNDLPALCRSRNSGMGSLHASAVSKGGGSRPTNLEGKRKIDPWLCQPSPQDGIGLSRLVHKLDSNHVERSQLVCMSTPLNFPKLTCDANVANLAGGFRFRQRWESLVANYVQVGSKFWVMHLEQPTEMIKEDLFFLQVME